jgi:signal transduction histidine kinase
MSRLPLVRRSYAAFASALVALCFALGAEAAGPKRVLVLHSFGRDFAPYDTIATVFRTELAQRSPQPISFVEINLDFRRAVDEKQDQAFVQYLKARTDEGPPDVVVTLAPPAARFYLRHRAELFPGTPLVISALDARIAEQLPRRPEDAVVAGRIDFPALVGNILQVLPETQTIAVVHGTSDQERFWIGELKREFAPFAGRVNFEWMDDLSLAQMLERVARLPPHSAILYGLLIVDSAGVPHERQDALAKLLAVANAPIFGLYESELGTGVVGGPYSSQRIRGEHMATAALRALGMPTTALPLVDITGPQPPVYDWRQLERWNIDPGRLPPGSEVRYKPPSMWEEHRTAVVATATALLLQAALIAALLVQRGRRRRAEQEAEHLGGRILTAQEDERRRLAREMHDDVTQRLAALAIDAARMQTDAGAAAGGKPLENLRARLVQLSEDVHSLSYRLHPAVIEDLGLVAALRVECDRVARNEPVSVDFECADLPKKVDPGKAICLFRVAQEALRNVVRHARARHVSVSLQETEGGITLSVRDDGKGLGEAGDARRASLGLVSMRERVRLVGGKLDIVSRPNQGTTVLAWVPHPEAA